jgi:glycosyltransferase involved in cell wall biosynthesis
MTVGEDGARLAIDRDRLRATFVLEQHLGHATFAENLRAAVSEDPSITARWVDVSYASSGAWWERLPLLPEAVRGTLRGRAEVNRGVGAPRDITFFNTQVPAVIAGRRARRGPYVLCTDITPLQYDRMAEAYAHRADRPGPFAAAKFRWNRRVFRAATAWVAWSSWTAGSLVEDYGVSADRVHVISPGVDLTRWHPSGHRADGPVRLLFVGADFERKGGPLLLDAFDRLPTGTATLDIVTKSPLAERPGITVHRDFGPNDAGLIALYGHCDVFVLPSRAEAFGIAAAEASAAGLPVVASDVGGLVDIVVDGRTGFLVPPDDAVTLAARLRQLVDDPSLRDRFGDAAAAHARQHFDAAANARRIVELLHSGRSR